MSQYAEYQKRKRRAIAASRRRQLEHAHSKEGIDTYSTIRIEWRSSSCMVVFDYNCSEKTANILQPAKQYFGRLTKNVRQNIENTLPEQLRINLEIKEFYIPGVPGNVKRYRYFFSVVDADLEEWFKKASLLK